MSQSVDVDFAVLAQLADPTLASLMPGGVYFDIVPASAGSKFVLVELYDHEDQYQFQGRAFERFVYDITAVEKASAIGDGEDARQRIEAVLQDVALTITGYDHSKTRRVRYLRFMRPDENDRANRWQHRGGRYEVIVSPV